MILNETFEANPDLGERNLVGFATPSDRIPDTMTDLSAAVELGYDTHVCRVVQRQRTSHMATRHAKHNVGPLNELDGQCLRLVIRQVESRFGRYRLRFWMRRPTRRGVGTRRDDFGIDPRFFG